MIGGLLDKISASLGKSFLFAGLMPAAVGFIAVTAYRLGFEQLWSSAPASAEDLKKVTALGVSWLALAFVLFAIRTWIFDWFQRMPRGPLGPLLLQRWLRKRDQTRDKVRLLEWQITVAQWRDFDPSKAIYRPKVYPLPKPDLALDRSRAARSLLRAMKPANVYPGWGECNILLNGLCGLFAITADDECYEQRKAEIDAEHGAWLALDAPHIQTILDNLLRHLQREWAAAYEENLQFSEGAWIYPTAIGNRLAALDDYAERRYGTTTATIWDRLWWILPEPSRQEVSDARLTVETLINLVAVLLGCGVIFTGMLVAGLIPRWSAHAPDVTLERVLIAIVSFGLAIACYRGAVFAMKALASRMMTLIDTNRLQLLAALGYSFETVSDEVEAFAELNLFFVQARQRRSDRKLKLPKGGDKEEKADKPEKKAERGGAKAGSEGDADGLEASG